MNIYSNTFNPGNPCSTWIASNAFLPSSGGISFYSEVNISLNAGDVIEVVLSGFGSSDVGAFTVNMSSQNGGMLLNQDFPVPGFDYKFVIYNADTEIIIDIVDTPDLTDASTYTSGNYTVSYTHLTLPTICSV